MLDSLDLLDLPELPTSELSTRRSSLQQLLIANGLSGVLLHSRVEQYYYAGIAIDGLLWISQDDSKLLVRRNIPLVKNATDLERQKIDEKTRFMNGLNGILDNTQRVKLTMFKTKFAKDMQEQIRIKRKMMAK